MDTKANLANRRKINELAVGHNKLTTLVACLLNEVQGLKKDLREARGGSGSDGINNSNNNMSNMSHQQNRGMNQQINPNKFPNFNELRAEDILKQLAINSSDN